MLNDPLNYTGDSIFVKGRVRDQGENGKVNFLTHR
jgi:hypothetical protein